MIDTSVARPELFVARDGSTESRGRALTLFRRLQDIVLLAWVSHVIFVPQQFTALVGVVGVVALWALMTVVGGWHIVKYPAQRGQAAWVIAAFPSAFMFVSILNTMIGLPVVGPPTGHYLFYVALSIFPLVWLGRWLLRATGPRPENTLRKRLTTTIFLAVAFMLMLQSLFLVWVLFHGDDFASFKKVFGGDWYTNLLMATLGTTMLLAIAAIPYVVLRFVRGSENRLALVGILVCILITVICTVGTLGFFSMLSYG